MPHLRQEMTVAPDNTLLQPGGYATELFPDSSHTETVGNTCFKP